MFIFIFMFSAFCDGYKSLHQACSTINADAPLYSLFRGIWFKYCLCITLAFNALSEILIINFKFFFINIIIWNAFILWRNIFRKLKDCFLFIYSFRTVILKTKSKLREYIEKSFGILYATRILTSNKWANMKNLWQNRAPLHIMQYAIRKTILE